MNKIVIAIDGPAGAGKSTIARTIADRLGILYIDTGAMYRAVTLEFIRNSVEINDIDRIKKLIDNIDIRIIDNKIYLDGKDVTADIRTQKVNKLVSPISAIFPVREKLIQLQCQMASDNSVIMDGRDIGTNVLKDADVKIFLTASIDERAKRRCIELKSKGYDVDIESVREEIRNRDISDSSRKVNPLRKAVDALTVDTTYKSVEDVVNEILNIVKKR